MRTSRLSWSPLAQDFHVQDDAKIAQEAQFALYFGPNPIIEDGAFQRALRAACPNALLLGCTTGTLIHGQDVDDGAAMAVAVHLHKTRVALASRSLSIATSYEAGAQLAQELNKPDLAGVLVLCDSLNVDGVQLVAGLRAHLSGSVPISGGLASDGSDFVRTLVGANDVPREGVAAAMGFYGDAISLSQGCAHGWDIFGPPRRITKARGVDLFELDGKPALDLYEAYLGEDAADLPGSALRFPLLVSNPDKPSEEVIRTVLNVDRQSRSMTFASAIPEGWRARLMRGAFDNLAVGAETAARQVAEGATQDLEGLALFVSCVGRRIVMGQETVDEIEAASRILGERFAQIGFYSHGEISARSDDGFCGLHNQTMTILAIQEAA